MHDIALINPVHLARVNISNHRAAQGISTAAGCQPTASQTNQHTLIVRLDGGQGTEDFWQKNLLQMSNVWRMLFIRPSIHPFVCGPTQPSICLSIPPPSIAPPFYGPDHPPIYPSYHLSVHPSISPSLHPSVDPPTHPSVHPSLCPSVLPV